MTAEQSKELLLSVQGLKKNFGEREILKGIDFDVHKGEVVCVIGPSGSGKSTLIRCVNYLEQPTDGVIGYRGENVLECFKNLPLYRTKVLSGRILESLLTKPARCVFTRATIAASFSIVWEP